MRLAGITLTLLGLAAMVWFSVLTGPDPEIRCGTDSNLVVAWNGYDSFPERPAQRECRRLAVVDLAKGAALGTPLILAGIALIIAGGQRRTDRFEPAEVPTGRRSEDGTSWWDGYRWHPIAPESAGSPPARADDPAMAFGQQSGPPATHKQVQYLESLLQKAGHTSFRDARGPLGLTQRQAGGKFTRDEASALIDQLLASDPDHEAPIGSAPSMEQRSASDRLEAERVQALGGMPADLLADELRRRGWSVTEP